MKTYEVRVGLYKCSGSSNLKRYHITFSDEQLIHFGMSAVFLEKPNRYVAFHKTDNPLRFRIEATDHKTKIAVKFRLESGMECKNLLKTYRKLSISGRVLGLRDDVTFKTANRAVMEVSEEGIFLTFDSYLLKGAVVPTERDEILKTIEEQEAHSDSLYPTLYLRRICKEVLLACKKGDISSITDDTIYFRTQNCLENYESLTAKITTAKKLGIDLSFQQNVFTGSFGDTQLTFST